MAKPTCTVDGCERENNARQMCGPHYKRWQKYGDPMGAAQRRTACSVEGCGRPWRSRDWCQMHYQRWSRHGDPLFEPAPSPCIVTDCGAPRHSDGYCVKHFARWKRHGSPDARIRGEVVDGMRICCACGTDKPVDEFPNRKAGRCKTCRAAYLSMPAQRAKRKAWADAHADLMREYMRSYARVRRSRMASLTVAFSPEAMQARMDYYGNRCWMCGGAFQHIDHVKPVSKGGPHMLANLRPACGPCNRSKSAKWEGPHALHALAA